MPRRTAVYLRLGGNRRGVADQRDDLLRWAEDQTAPVSWYCDHFVGSDGERPSFDSLSRDIEARSIARVVVWRLDRLGLTPGGLTTWFAALRRRDVALVSLKDRWELADSEGRLVAEVIASVAVFEREPRSERILAGQATARAHGVRWGGSVKGWRWKVTDEQETLISRLRREGCGVSASARATGLTRKTVSRVLKASGIVPKRRRGGLQGHGAGRAAGRPRRRTAPAVRGCALTPSRGRVGGGGGAVSGEDASTRPPGGPTPGSGIGPRAGPVASSRGRWPRPRPRRRAPDRSSAGSGPSPARSPPPPSPPP